MIVHFCAADDKVGAAIKLLTLSQFSHCALEIDGQIWEATFKKGVSCCSKDDFRSRYPHSKQLIVRGSASKALLFLQAQLGKKYDFAALAAFPLRENWQDDNRWFCSELVAAALVQCGALSIKHDVSRVTPRDLWLSRKIRWV